MKKVTAYIIILLIMIPSLATSGSLKVIQLKDGSTLKGEILKFDNGIYTVKTEHLGQIQLNDDSILSIGALDAATDAAASNAASLKGQVESVQGQIYNDKAIMEDIKNLSQDEEIMKILKDPSLMNDIMTFDEEKIRNNPSVQKLLQHEDVNRIMKDVEKKLDQE